MKNVSDRKFEGIPSGYMNIAIRRHSEPINRFMVIMMSMGRLKPMLDAIKIQQFLMVQLVIIGHIFSIIFIERRIFSFGGHSGCTTSERRSPFAKSIEEIFINFVNYLKSTIACTVMRTRVSFESEFQWNLFHNFNFDSYSSFRKRKKIRDCLLQPSGRRNPPAFK